VQVGLVTGGVAIWEAAVAGGIVSEFFFGRPSGMVAYLIETSREGYLLRHTWVTLYEQVLGFALGTMVGTGLGLALWWSPYLTRVFEPLAMVLNAMPKIVIAPILVIWFGIGPFSKVMIALMICGVVAWLSTTEGTRQTDDDQIDLIRALGGNRWHVFTKVVVPSCQPWIISTLRLNIGLALIGALTGEFLSSTEGLGYLIDRTSQLYQMSHTMAVLLVITGLAALQYYLVTMLEIKLLAWSRDELENNFIT
jgi:NitT/TauT family transport system permease protein